MTTRESTLYGDLKNLADDNHATFTAKLVPTIPHERIMGIKVPLLRQLAWKLRRQHSDDVERFLQHTPHYWLEEDLLHALILNEEKDFGELIRRLEEFFPVIDNWMVSDIIAPRIAKTHHDEFEPYIHSWLSSNEVYTIRVALQLLMSHYLDENFDPEHLIWVARIRHNDYYARMGCAWYLATALAKQPQATTPYFFAAEGSEVLLEVHTRRMAIRKALESRRIPEGTKQMLREERQRLTAT